MGWEPDSRHHFPVLCQYILYASPTVCLMNCAYRDPPQVIYSETTQHIVGDAQPSGLLLLPLMAQQIFQLVFFSLAIHLS